MTGKRVHKDFFMKIWFWMLLMGKTELPDTLIVNGWTQDLMRHICLDLGTENQNSMADKNKGEVKKMYTFCAFSTTWLLGIYFKCSSTLIIFCFRVETCQWHHSAHGSGTILWCCWSVIHPNDLCWSTAQNDRTLHFPMGCTMIECPVISVLWHMKELLW